MATGFTPGARQGFASGAQFGVSTEYRHSLNFDGSRSHMPSSAYGSQ